jgi:hypothetical protein
MDVVEVEELEEDEILLHSNVTLTPLSMQDLLEFYEGNLEEGEGEGEGEEEEDRKEEAEKPEEDEGKSVDGAPEKDSGELESKGSRSGDTKTPEGEDLEQKASEGSKESEDLESKESRGLSSVAGSEDRPSSGSVVEGVAADPSVKISGPAVEEPDTVPSVPPPPSKPTSLLERRLTPGNSRMVSLQRMREVCGMSTRPTSPSGPGGVWDHEQLDKAQFVQLVELFLGREPRLDTVDAVAEYIKTNYIQAEKVRSWFRTGWDAATAMENQYCMCPYCACTYTVCVGGVQKLHCIMVDAIFRKRRNARTKHSC